MHKDSDLLNHFDSNGVLLPPSVEKMHNHSSDSSNGLVVSNSMAVVVNDNKREEESVQSRTRSRRKSLTLTEKNLEKVKQNVKFVSGENLNDNDEKKTSTSTSQKIDDKNKNKNKNTNTNTNENPIANGNNENVDPNTNANNDVNVNVNSGGGGGDSNDNANGNDNGNVNVNANSNSSGNGIINIKANEDFSLTALSLNIVNGKKNIFGSALKMQDAYSGTSSVPMDASVDFGAMSDGNQKTPKMGRFGNYSNRASMDTDGTMTNGINIPSELVARPTITGYEQFYQAKPIETRLNRAPTNVYSSHLKHFSQNQTDLQNQIFDEMDKENEEINNSEDN